MIVRAMMIDGRSVTFCARRIALRMASRSCPSIFCVCQPTASKRFFTSSENARRVSPSMEMWLSS